MNKFSILLVVIIIFAASSLVGISVKRQTQFSNTPGFTKADCLDEGAPIKSKSVKVNGEQYNLVKSGVEVFSTKVMFEMGIVGKTEDADPKDVYSIRSGRSSSSDVADVMYVLQGRGSDKGIDPTLALYVFNLYLKDGKDVSDEMKKCSSTGGFVMVDPDQTSFPPSFIDPKKVIVSGVNPLNALSYIRSEVGKSKVADIEKAGAKNIGILVINNKDYRIYFHNSTVFLIDTNDDAYQYDPSDKEIETDSDKSTLQIKNIQFVETLPWGWWMPVCKPAIYLYPTKKTQAVVTVVPKGFFTLTIPSYPKGGWRVSANPSGEIVSGGKTYPYLYYESMIRNEDVTKPSEGFVVAFENLPNFYSAILPRLGLSQKESDEFRQYWIEVLPKAPYYFVGIMSQEAIESIEPLTVVPSPDTIIRVRLYFEQLEQKISVLEPFISTPQRKGFTVVEWGGMVKTDKDKPFTCSQ